MAAVITVHSGVALAGVGGIQWVQADDGVTADDAGLAMPGRDPIQPIATTLARSLDVTQPSKVEHLILEGEVTHRSIVDRGGHLHQLLEQLVRDRRDQSLEYVVGGRFDRLTVQSSNSLGIDVGEDLLASRVVAGVVEAVGLQEGTAPRSSSAQPIQIVVRPDSSARRMISATSALPCPSRR